MPEILQHIVVTIVACGAALTVVRRVFSVVQPAGGGNPKCANCPSAQAHGQGPRAVPAAGLRADAKPLTFVR